jgi:hypothetical protein
MKQSTTKQITLYEQRDLLPHVTLCLKSPERPSVHDPLEKFSLFGVSVCLCVEALVFFATCRVLLQPASSGSSSGIKERLYLSRLLLHHPNVESVSMRLDLDPLLPLFELEAEGKRLGWQAESNRPDA